MGPVDGFTASLSWKGPVVTLRRLVEASAELDAGTLVRVSVSHVSRDPRENRIIRLGIEDAGLKSPW